MSDTTLAIASADPTTPLKKEEAVRKLSGHLVEVVYFRLPGVALIWINCEGVVIHD